VQEDYDKYEKVIDLHGMQRKKMAEWNPKKLSANSAD
jgi:hypothetical protein